MIEKCQAKNLSKFDIPEKGCEFSNTLILTKLCVFFESFLYCYLYQRVPVLFLFQGYISELVEQNFTSYVDTVNREPILFGDYRNALTEDPRLYEDIVDYEAAKAIFDEVRSVSFEKEDKKIN